MRTALALARADFLERVRRFGFLVTLGITVWAARAALPPRGSSYVTVHVGTHRALYNSAGVGSMVALLTAAFLSLIGFYLVKGAVERDRRTGVGEILGATRVSRVTYVLGKLLSNAAVLLTIAAVMLVVAAAMQLVLGEDRRLDPLALGLPFVLLTMPAMAVVAASAVLFDVVPWLRGGLGNIAYFFLFTALIASTVPGSGLRLPIGDPEGMGVVLPSLAEECARRFPDFAADPHDMGVGISVVPAARRTTPFRWSGVRWTIGAVGARLAWIGIALLIALLAARLFDRFAGAGATTRASRKSCERGSGTVAAEIPAAAAMPLQVPIARLTPAPRAERLAPLLSGELRLVRKGLGRWWTLVATGLAALCLFLPIAAVRAAALPLAAIWPILAWSALGWREARHGTDALLFSSPRPLRRQLPAAWLAGALLAAAMLGPYALRSALAGDPGALAGCLAGLVFVPSFALASGVWTGSGKLFEITYLVLWYVGPLNRVPQLDFLGAVPGAWEAHAAFLALGFVLLALAFAGRARQLGR